MFRSTFFAVALLSAPVAFAAPSPAKQAFKEAKAELKEQERDLKELDRLTRKWEKAVEKGSEKAEARADEKLADWLDAEEVENREARREARSDLIAAGADPDSLGEVRRDRAGRTYTVGVPPRAEDELAEWKQLVAHSQHTHGISKELLAIQPAFSMEYAPDDLYALKEGLLLDLRKTAVRDVKRAKRDLNEAARRLRR